MATTYVDARPETVFAVIADPRKPFLTSNRVTHMEVVGEQTAGVGTVYRWTFRLPFGLRFTFDEVVTEWVEPERFAYRATSGWDYRSGNCPGPRGRRDAGHVYLALSSAGDMGLVDPQVAGTTGQ